MPFSQLPPTPAPTNAPSLSISPSLLPSIIPSEVPSLSMGPSNFPSLPSLTIDNDEWFLGSSEILDITGNVLRIKHRVGSNSDSIQNVTLWYSDFSERIDQTQELLTLSNLITASTIFTYDVTIHTEFVRNASSQLVQYEDSQESVGSITFGSMVKRELHKNRDDVIGVTWKKTTFSLSFDLRYDIPDITATITDTVADSEEVTFLNGLDVDVCLCMNENDFECLPDDVELQLRVNEYVQVCFTPKSALYEIRNLEMTLQSLDGTLTHKAISFGTDGPNLDPFTTREIGQQGSNDYDTIRYKVYLLSELFKNNNANLAVKGSVFISFGKGSKQAEFRLYDLRLRLESDIGTGTLEETNCSSTLTTFISSFLNDFIDLF